MQTELVEFCIVWMRAYLIFRAIFYQVVSLQSVEQCRDLVQGSLCKDYLFGNRSKMLFEKSKIQVFRVLASYILA